MRQLSEAGQAAINDIAQRHGFSPDAVMAMLDAVIAGNGSMAQFNHPEFAGSGQWMRGGMIMISDMFNNGLKARIDGLCQELANLVANQPGLIQTGSFQSQSQGGGQVTMPYQGQAQGGSFQGQSQGGQFQGGQFQDQGGLFQGGQAQQQSGGSGASLFVPGTSGNWWPADLGAAASVGAQNNVRYAYFPAARRLAIDLNGQVTVYDTQDHQIGGFSQQQGGGSSLTFTSQYGVVPVSSLPVVSGVAPSQPASGQPASGQPAPVGSQAPLGQSEIMDAIEKLADLKSRGILSEEEFSAKKAELLSRL